jgi:hypothetical protein
MSKDILQKHLDELTGAIRLTLKAKKHIPTLILIYSAIDILAWLNRPLKQKDVERRDFISWVDQYLLRESKLLCSSMDLYAARCAIVHSYQAESKLSREGKAKQIWYAWGQADVDRLRERIQKAKLNQIAVAVHVEDLVEALEHGIYKFITWIDSNHNEAKKVYSRVKTQLFANIPHDLL